MAFLVAGALEALALFSAEVGLTAAAITGSEAIGSTVAASTRGAVIGAVTNTVKNAAESAINTTFGTNVVEDVQDVASDVINYNSMFGNRQNSFDGYRKTGFTNYNRPVPTSNQSSLPSFPQKPSTLPEPTLPEPNWLDRTQPNQSLVIGTQIGELIGMHVTEVIEKQPDYPADLPDNEIPNFLEKYAEEGPDPTVSVESLKKVIDENPKYGYLINHLVNYQLANVAPKNDRYRYISMMYQGRSIHSNSVQQTIDPATGLKIFKGTDEIGQVYIYKEKRDSIKIPPIYGVWVGLNSPNNSLPIMTSLGQRSLLDTFAFFHDCEYHETMFSRDADYRLISRIINNWDRLAEEEKIPAFIAVEYFSTLGNTVSGYKKVFDDITSRSSNPLGSLASSAVASSDDISLFDNLVSQKVIEPSVDYSEADRIVLQ